MSVSELPNGWVAAVLADAVTLRTGPFGSSLHQSDYVTNGVPLVNPMHIVNGRIRPSTDVTVTPETAARLSEFELKQGDLVLARRGEMGRCAVVQEKEAGWLCGTGSLIVRPEPRLLAPAFLQGFLSSAASVKYLLEASVGSTMANLNQQHLLSMRLPLPPLAEQTRIVEKLEELLSDLDAGVAELKAAQKKLAQYRQSLLKAAVEGALTAEWRQQHPPAETGAQLLQRILTQRRARWEARQLAKFKELGKTPPKDWQKKYPEPVQPDTSGLPALPQGWVWASVDQLTDFITSGSRGWADYYADAGATFIRSQNINKDWLDLSDIAFVNPPKGSEGARTRVQKNDVLLTITGANVGKAAHVESDMDEAYVSQHVALIRPAEVTLAKVLHLFLTAEAGGRGQLDKEAYGAGKPGLNLQQVASVCVPLASAAEIEVLVNAANTQLGAATAKEVAVELLLKQSTAQRQNILRAAFAGQLVPQDPTDEPASVLLERIRAERAARQTPRKPRGRPAKAVA